jgi:hypothetical protein
MNNHADVFYKSNFDSIVYELTDQIKSVWDFRNKSFEQEVKQFCDGLAERLMTMALQLAPCGIHAEAHLAEFQERNGLKNL